MSFRAKPVVKRAHRPSWETTSRRTLYLNIFFGLVVLLGILILGGAAAASYYGDHFAALATVNGTNITKDQYRDRFLLQSFRIDFAERRIRTDMASGRINEATANNQLAFLDQQRQNLGTSAIEELIDAELIIQLAAREGVTVTAEDLATEIRREATSPERRHAWIISAVPEVTAPATESTAEQIAKARAEIDAMLAEVKAGKPFEEVAKAGSDDVSKANGGDLGFLQKENSLLDPKVIESLFTLQASGVSDVLTGEDGTFYVVRVSEIVPEEVDGTYESQMRDAKVNPEAYQRAVRAQAAQQKIEAKLIAEVTAAPTPQRRVSEIFLVADASEVPGDRVDSRHILFSPKDDPTAAQALAADDPAWKTAEDEARAAYEELKKDPAKFQEMAKTLSDDTGSGASGGDIGFQDQLSLDKAYSDAIFAPGLVKDQILEPVRSSFGWHIIQYIDRQVPPASRMRSIEAGAAAGEDFAALAKQFSESATKDEGGDIGWVAKYQLDSIKESAIFKAAVGGLTPVITVAEGLYLFKIVAEETRLPDADQAEELKSNAFGNWYTARKNESTIVREYQSGTNVPTV